ncbi:hypothetical protein [Olivibacter domesticus]|uniref:Uncharacterized protein n=1 Tax=Olivibacter domesticus TaxID=407022 RepID=A0A1H7IC83_OLID1|nr:hypothetical protein [Olivibacter domesticus]SEK59140.1 hypothetical protein SAMN05661044_00628 [Olivibacter domesticus]
MEEIIREGSSRELPAFRIGRMDLVVDVLFSEIREKGHPENCISLEDMDKRPNGGYSFVLDGDCLLPSYAMGSGSLHQVEVNVPEMVKFDPEGMALKYGVKVTDLPARDMDCKCDRVLVDQLLDGTGIAIKIIDQIYQVDTVVENLRPIDGHGGMIAKHDLDWSPDMEKFFFYFDTENKQTIKIPENSLEPPKNAVMVVLPYDLFSNSIGSFVSRNPGINRDFFSRFPVQLNFESRIYPLSQSPIGQLIREQQQQKIPAEEDHNRINKRGLHI